MERAMKIEEVIEGVVKRLEPHMAVADSAAIIVSARLLRDAVALIKALDEELRACAVTGKGEE